MATIEDFKGWYERDLGRYGRWQDHVEIVDSQVYENEPKQLHIRVYTDVNCYAIQAREPSLRDFPLAPPSDGDPAQSTEDGPTVKRMDNGYLGCISRTRKPRAGEDWSRGSDLSDGPLTEEGWHRILADIVSYELVRVHVRTEAERQADIPTPLPAA